MITPGQNRHNPLLGVEHDKLTPAVPDVHRWARQCPTCGDGMLLVCRDPATLVLQEYDVCTLCGQRVRYDDIEDMRRRDWA